MGLSNVLNISSSGLAATQTGIDLVARNIANAGVEGYTRKTANYQNLVAGTQDSGVFVASIGRGLDQFVQQQLLSETSQLSHASTTAEFLQRVDQLFGEPGSSASLDNLINEFHSSLQEASSSPESYAARETVVAQAQALTNQLNDISDNILSLRQFAEDQIATGVVTINDALAQLEDINGQLQNVPDGSLEQVELLDSRDGFVGQISQYITISFRENETGQATIYTSDGHKLIDATKSQLSFDHQGRLTANSQYSNDPTERDVGTISIIASSGYEIDLLNSPNALGGQLGALVALRDDVLTQTQRQLDEIASSFALSLSTETLNGTPVTAGAATGFDLDVSGLIAGNIITLDYTDNIAAQTNRVSIVRVDDPSLLPLSNDVTADLNDIVIGVDFSAGLAAVAASLDAALGADITVTSPSAGVLQFLDDGAPNNSDINSVTGAVTVSGTQDQGLGLNLFVDRGQATNIFSANLGPPDQKIGFASRISVNDIVKNNNELLVRYSTSPETPLGDNSRPLEILRRLGDVTLAFSPSTGIGGGTTPYEGSLLDFSRTIIDFQTSASERADRALASQEIVTSSLRERHEAAIGVDVDQELSELLILQQAFAANARVLQTASELINTLLQIR